MSKFSVDTDFNRAVTGGWVFDRAGQPATVSVHSFGLDTGTLLFAAIWSDGRVVWSIDYQRLSGHFYSGVIDQRRVGALVSQLSKICMSRWARGKVHVMLHDNSIVRVRTNACSCALAGPYGTSSDIQVNTSVEWKMMLDIVTSALPASGLIHADPDVQFRPTP